MSLVAAIGDAVHLEGYALAGVRVVGADDDRAVCAAWAGLAAEVACVILTPAARRALGPRVDERAHVVWVVLPD